jgi:hypothetical protein
VRRPIRRVALVCVAVVLAGCGSAVATPSAGPSAGVAPTPTPAASLSTTDLAVAFMACAHASGVDDARLVAQLGQLGNVTETTLAAWQSLMGRRADVESAFGICVDGISWPPQLRSDVQQLLVANGQAEELDREAASAPLWWVISHTSQASADADEEVAAEALVAKDLGLQPVPSSSLAASPDASAPSA